jgi:glycosyltransferase involved in cell wall biosynthesis
MKIAYVTTHDSSDIRAWSGLIYEMYRTLQNRGFHTESVDKLVDSNRYITITKKIFYTKVLSKTYLRDREPATLKSYAAQVERHLAYKECDLVFSPGTCPIAYLQTKKPVVFWTDATFAGMINFYTEFSNLCVETIRNGNKIEQLALSKCNLAIYSSEWAANTAITNYDVDPEKVKVVPFGANIECDRDREDINRLIAGKTFEICKLLFVGVDWFRKGGDIALRVCELLNQQGFKTELHVVGCNPPIKTPDFVKLYGFISKQTEAGRRTLNRLFSESHFLILPSRFECFGVVFAEASSFGLPALATRIGGIPSAINDGKNGKLFSLEEAPESYCDYIVRMTSQRQEYEALAHSSFEEYTGRLNWTSAGKRVHELIYEFCS